MASDNKDRGPKIKTPIFKVNWPNVLTARSAEEGKPAFFSLAMMFRTKENPTGDASQPIVSLLALKTAAAAILTAKFGPQTNWPKINPVFRSGLEKKDYDGFDAGIEFCSAKSKRKPLAMMPDMTDIVDQNEFYSGCLATAMIAPYWYDVKNNKGIAWSLISVQKQEDGEALGGGASRDDFTAIAPPEGGLSGAGAVGASNGADPLGGGAVAGAEAGAVDMSALGL